MGAVIAVYCGNGEWSHLYGRVVFMAILILGSCFALFLPIGAGLDEPMHIARVEQLAEGYFLPQEIECDGLNTTLVSPASNEYPIYGGETDSALFELLVRGNRAFYGNRGRSGYLFPTWDDPDLQINSEMGEDTTKWLFPNTSINSIASYLPQTIAYAFISTFISNPVIVVLFVRLAGVVSFAAATMACMRILPFGRIVVAFVALLPVSLSTMSVVTADTMTFVFVSLFISCIIKLLYSDEPSCVIWITLGVSLAGVCLAKITYVPFGLLLLALPLAKSCYRSRQNIVKIGIIGGGSLILFILWYLQIHDVNTGIMWSSEINPDVQKAIVLDQPVIFIKAAAKTLFNTDLLTLSPSIPYGSIINSSWMTVIPLTVVMLSLSKEMAIVANLGKRPRAVFAVFLFALIALVISLIYLALYLQFTPPGAGEVSGIQTRYFSPIQIPGYIALILLVSIVTGANGAECPADSKIHRSSGSTVLVGGQAVAYTAVLLMGLLTTVSFLICLF